MKKEIDRSFTENCVFHEHRGGGHKNHKHNCASDRLLFGECS